MIRYLFISIALIAFSTSCYSQGYVNQSGSITSGRAAKWSANRTLMDAGPASGGNSSVGISELPIVNTGQPLCIYDAPITNPAGYHKLCLGANVSNNGALLSYSAGGGAAQKDCNFEINGTTFGCIGGGGNVVGPSPTTVNEPALWNALNGTLLKNAAGVVMTHTGGQTNTDTTVPTSFVFEPSFGFTSFTATYLKSTGASTHAGQIHSTAVIARETVGSGANGPGNDDLALTVKCDQTNYLTTTTLGEAGCVWANLTHGAQGDVSGYLMSLRRVDDPAVPNYGQTLFEATLSHIARTTGVAVREMHQSVGYGITGFQNVTGVAAGVGGVCRLTVSNTANFDVVWGVTVTGIQGAPECNGYWAGTIIDGTHIDLNNSVLIGAWTSGGAVGTPLYGLGGPNFGFESRAQTGQNGTAFMVSRGIAPFNGTWGSAFRVRYADDNTVAFDMSANSGRFVVQPPTQGSMVDENYSATFLNGPIRWAGNTVAVPRDNPQYPGTNFPGGGALGFNHSAGSGEVDLWNLYPTAVATLNIYQKTGAAAQTLLSTFAPSGVLFFTPAVIDTAAASSAPLQYRAAGALKWSVGREATTNDFTIVNNATATGVMRINTATNDVSIGAGGPSILGATGQLQVSTAVPLSSSVALTNGAAAQVGTLNNAPAAGDPTKWIPIDDNGTTRYIPAW